MAPLRAKSFGSAIQNSALASLLIFEAACGGGGGSGPTEPQAPNPEPFVLQISWEYNGATGDVVSGLDSVDAGDNIVLYNEPGGHCDGLPEGDCWPDVSECRTTFPFPMVQAYYHDSLSADGPGKLGQLVQSGCSTAWDHHYYTKCCLVDP